MSMRTSAFFKQEKLCLKLTSDFIGRRMGRTSERPLGIASAILCYYWFGGDIIKLPSLIKISRWAAAPEAVVRSIIAVSAARSPKCFASLLPNFVGYPGDDVGRLVQFINGIDTGRISALVKFAHPKERWPLA